MISSLRDELDVSSQQLLDQVCDQLLIKKYILMWRTEISKTIDLKVKLVECLLFPDMYSQL